MIYTVKSQPVDEESLYDSCNSFSKYLLTEVCILTQKKNAMRTLVKCLNIYLHFIHHNSVYICKQQYCWVEKTLCSLRLHTILGVCTEFLPA